MAVDQTDVDKLKGVIDKTNDARKVKKVKSLDNFFAMYTSAGSVEKALFNTLHGINHEQTMTIIPKNKSTQGYTFFTRPQLNLTTENIRNIPEFYSLLTKDEYSVHRYVRNLLDPRLHYDGIKTTLVDPFNCFMPILTNTVATVSGWPDIVLPTYTTSSGIRREQWGMADGVTDIYESFDLDCTFSTLKDEPTTHLVKTWIKYASYVYEGMMSPYIDMIVENEIDYNTRIYRLIMDESKTYIKHMAATGASFPVNDPTGKIYDLNSKVHYTEQTAELNIRFKSFGAIYDQDILLVEFNRAQAIFNPDINIMHYNDTYGTKIQHNLEKIPPSLKHLFNNRGYPYINRDTLELEWYINRTDPIYKTVIDFLGD
jgi:hypothetical protein